MSKFELDEDMPMLDALLCGKELWDIKATLPKRRAAMCKVHDAIEQEHQYLLEHEPQDQFHACVLLGGLNLIAGLLKDVK